MKKNITSHWRPLFRAFCPFLIAITVLGAMPRTAQAQIYVTQVPDPLGSGIVSEYDATTGVVINSSLITGLVSPAGLVFVNGHLIVANSGLHAGQVGKYDAASGGVIDSSFIAALVKPVGVALSIDLFTGAGALFLVNPATGTIGKYGAGEFHGVLDNPSFITGLSDPTGLAVFGVSILFVANFTNGTVSEYDARTGAAINASFITGLKNPTCLAVFGSDTLFVADANGTVGKYNSSTGQAINAQFISRNERGDFITGLALVPHGFALHLLVVEANGTVGRYNPDTGTAINASFITGLSNPTAIAVQ